MHSCSFSFQNSAWRVVGAQQRSVNNQWNHGVVSKSRKGLGFGGATLQTHINRVPNSGLALTCCVILSKLLAISEPQFFLWNIAACWSTVPRA